MTQETEDVVGRAIANCTRKLQLRTEQVEELWASGDEERENDFAVAVNASDLRVLLAKCQSLSDRIDVLSDAVRVSAQAFRLLEEVAVAQLEHDKARNFIKLGDKCRAALHQEHSSGE